MGAGARPYRWLIIALPIVVAAVFAVKVYYVQRHVPRRGTTPSGEAAVATTPAGGSGQAAGTTTATGADEYATFVTTKGSFEVQLYPKKAPQTVASFVKLATGQRPWVNPLTNSLSTDPFYDGLLFYRTVPGAIIQTGDPTENGNGQVGFTLPIESNELKFDRAGRLSMAQSDPSDRSSQIFVTLRPMPELDKDNFVIFGQVVSGLDVARAIAEGPHKGQDHPLHPVAIEKVTISDHR